MSRLPSLSVIGGPVYDRDPDGWEHNAYRLRLRYDGRSMSLPYKMGMGHDSPPDLGDVFSSLISDASIAENIGPADVWEFASEFGFEINDGASYDRTRATLRAIHNQTDRLANLLGRRLMVALMDDPEGDATYGDVEHLRRAWERANAALNA